MSLKFKKQDKVKVISGKAKGSEGKIVEVQAAKNRVVIEGVNRAKKHMKPNRQNEKGGIVDKEMSIHISNIMLVSAKSNEPVRTRKVVENGKRIRVEKKSGKPVE